MSVRSAYWLLFALVVVAVPIEILLVAGPASGQEFKGLWQVWHPYYLLILGGVTLPIWLFFVVPLAKRLGGWNTVFGRLVLLLTLGQMAMIIIGPYLTFAEITCPTWNDGCTHPIGWVGTPGWGDLAYVATYPLAAAGIAQLLIILGTSVRAELRRHWYVPVAVALIFTVLLAPFGFDLAFSPGQTFWGNAVEVAYIAGSFVLLCVSLFAMLRLKPLGHSAFATPVRLLLLGTTMVVIGGLININTATTGGQYDINDPAITPLTVGLIAWMAAFLMLGGRLERLIGKPD